MSNLVNEEISSESPSVDRESLEHKRKRELLENWIRFVNSIDNDEDKKKFIMSL